VGAYSINIVGLSSKLHHFDYEIGDKFFRQYGSDLIQDGTFDVKVALDKHETFIETEFDINGVARLTCDRSLENFDYPIKSHHKLMFKFGDTNEELSDEIVMIHRDTATLELGQYIYEFIALSVPMKRLHPRFKEEEQRENAEGIEGKIVYSSGGDKASDNNEDDIDPRWNILKKLK
jgi:uncharacterized metal-binding protein YceD (DUF177 family)